MPTAIKDKKADVLVHAGGLVGYNDGSIDGREFDATVFSSVRMSAVSSARTTAALTVTNSNATGSVTGHGAVGGLVGANYGTITNSYSEAVKKNQ